VIEAVENSIEIFDDDFSGIHRFWHGSPF